MAFCRATKAEATSSAACCAAPCRHGKLLGLDKPFLAEAADTVINLMKGHYTELGLQRDRIVEILSLEEKKFSQTLNTGLTLLNELLDGLRQQGQQNDSR